MSNTRLYDMLKFNYDESSVRYFLPAYASTYRQMIDYERFIVRHRHDKELINLFINNGYILLMFDNTIKLYKQIDTFMDIHYIIYDVETYALNIFKNIKVMPASLDIPSSIIIDNIYRKCHIVDNNEQDLVKNIESIYNPEFIKISEILRLIPVEDKLIISKDTIFIKELKNYRKDILRYLNKKRIVTTLIRTYDTILSYIVSICNYSEYEDLVYSVLKTCCIEITDIYKKYRKLSREYAHIQNRYKRLNTFIKSNDPHFNEKNNILGYEFVYLRYNNSIISWRCCNFVKILNDYIKHQIFI